jgi:4-diphosphocytidyl-2-C-methyl-D-erythritol kinase
MTVFGALAPAKINLGLFLGPVRASDGRHELVSVMQSITLADELTLEPAPPGVVADEVLCPGVAGENLAARALSTFRERTGWAGPPQRLRIVKAIPIAAGLAGGSADAAAALRLASLASGLGDEETLRALAAELGADVPAQVTPGRWLASGAGERLHGLPDPLPPLGVLVLPLAHELATASVYAEADRLLCTRPRAELHERHRELAAALARGAPLPAAVELLHNDLQRPAVSLCPAIVEALAQARAAGAELAFVSGSGPTVVGLFNGSAQGRSGPALAERAAAELSGRVPSARAASTAGAGFAAAAVA